MANLKDRENAFENKFAHDADMAFRAEARRNRLLGRWAGGLLGHEGEALDAYTTEVIKSDFEEAGDEDVFRKLHGDLGDKASEAEIRAKMAECHAQAKSQLLDEAD
ncbi:MAG: DUF1476 domain-containing protein [Paracoccaceae bacterium]